jgi:orotidine-5'-phosphate decarboxylase
MPGTMDFLRRSAEERQTVLCFGIDPVLEKINAGSPTGAVQERIEPFFHDITDRLLEENEIAAIKPNYAYFARYGFDGLYVLEGIMQRYRNRIPIILDGKRGDIGKSSDAYATEAYDFWGADALTVSPYMGEDSVRPFAREGKLAYVLCRTSNAGAKDFQELKCGRKFLYEMVAEKAVAWGCGLVVGATSDSIKKLAKATKNEAPFLIPGIGAQGGDLEMVMEALKPNPHIHRVSASASIAYAYEKAGGNPAEAALKEAQKLNSVIREYVPRFAR